MQVLETFRNDLAHSIQDAWSGNVPLWKLVSIYWCFGFCIASFGLASVAWLLNFNSLVFAQQAYAVTLSFIGCHSIFILVSSWRRVNTFKSKVLILAVRVLLIFYVVLVFRTINFIPTPTLLAGI